jgi:hypothetical protein
MATLKNRIFQINHFSPAFLIVLTLALVCRLPYFWQAACPLNDGGMFAQIIDELRAAHFVLPAQTSYNFMGIPLAYPPLGFYFGALASELLGQTTIATLLWLPLAFNLATLFAFYFLALELLAARYQALCAACVYAVLPRSIDWFIMGAGLTRASGELFAVLSCWQFVRALKSQELRPAAWAGVWAGCAALCHLEAASFAAWSLITLALFMSCFRKNIRFLFLWGFISVIVAAPWALWCCKNVGIKPFLAAYKTLDRDFDPQMLTHFLYWVLCAFILPPLTLALARQVAAKNGAQTEQLIGHCRKWLFVIWLLIIWLTVPRSFLSHVTVPEALLVGWLAGAMALWLGERIPILRQNHLPALAIGLCGCLCAFFALRELHTRWHPLDCGRNLEHNILASLSLEDRAAMEWVRQNTHPCSRFFVFQRRNHLWQIQFAAEWFPYFTQRQSVHTVQGTEWLPNNAFSQAKRRALLIGLIKTSEDMRAVVDPDKLDYIYFSGPFDPLSRQQAALVKALPNFKPVFQLGNVEILRRQ